MLAHVVVEAELLMGMVAPLIIGLLRYPGLSLSITFGLGRCPVAQGLEGPMWRRRPGFLAPALSALLAFWLLHVGPDSRICAALAMFLAACFVACQAAGWIAFSCLASTAIPAEVCAFFFSIA